MPAQPRRSVKPLNSPHAAFTVPVRYQLGGVGGNSTVEASGEFPLRQTDLGLTPFSALLGALQVVDEMKIRFRIVAQAAATQIGH